MFSFVPHLIELLSQSTIFNMSDFDIYFDTGYMPSNFPLGFEDVLLTIMPRLFLGADATKTSEISIGEESDCCQVVSEPPSDDDKKVNDDWSHDAQMIVSQTGAWISDYTSSVASASSKSLTSRGTNSDDNLSDSNEDQNTQQIRVEDSKIRPQDTGVTSTSTKIREDFVPLKTAMDSTNNICLPHLVCTP